MIDVIIFFAGLLNGFVLAALWLAPDTPFWRGFRNGYSLKYFWRRS
jgi:hypothetical protein